MKRTLTLAAAVALVASLGIAGPAAGDRVTKKKVAAKLCAAEKRADKGAFKAKYGKKAMRKCKRATVDEAEEAIENPAKFCMQERERLGVDVFKETYGTNPNKANAFGKCVNIASGDLDDEVEEPEVEEPEVEEPEVEEPEVEEPEVE